MGRADSQRPSEDNSANHSFGAPQPDQVATMLTNSKLSFLSVVIVDSGLDVQEVATKSPSSFIYFYV